MSHLLWGCGWVAAKKVFPLPIYLLTTFQLALGDYGRVTTELIIAMNIAIVQ